MKKLLTIVGLGAFGYISMFIGRVYQTIDIGTLYRRAELGNEEAIAMMEKVSEVTNEFNEAVTKLKKQIRG